MKKFEFFLHFKLQILAFRALSQAFELKNECYLKFNEPYTNLKYMSVTLSFRDMACRIFYFSHLNFSKVSRKSFLVITRDFFRLSERLYNAGQ